LELSDPAYLLACNGSHLCTIWLPGPLVEPCLLLEEHRSGRRLQDEGEALVGEYGYFDREDRILSLRASIELLAERHDVDPLRSECRTDRRSRGRLPCRDLQLDESGDLLCHFTSSGYGRCLTPRPWTPTVYLASLW